MTTPVRYQDAPAVPAGTSCELCVIAVARVNDHCHAHGWVRGALCKKCNAILGSIENGRRLGADLGPEHVAGYLARCPDCSPRIIAKSDPLATIRLSGEGVEKLRRLTRQVAAMLDRRTTQSDVLEAVADICLNRIDELAEDLRPKGDN